MAMHVHSSFSEGVASMRAQLSAAKTNTVDVVWWSDHDWRMAAHGYRQVIHCSALKEYENNVAVTWKKATSAGTGLVASSMAIVKSVFSPADTTPGSSLSVSGTGNGPSFSTVRAVATGGRDNLRSTLSGQSIALEVHPLVVGPDAMCEIRVSSSYQPAMVGRPAGRYVLSYRIGGPDPPGTMRADGLTGVIVLAATPATWNSLTLAPAADAAQLWPGLDVDDLSMCELSFGIQSRNGVAARSYVDYIRFTRSLTAASALALQQRLMGSYATVFPSVTQHQGLEVSLYEQHVNWFGGQVAIPDYGTLRISPLIEDDAATADQVAMIHAAGGLASLNHLFGASNDIVAEDEQERRRRATATKLIGLNAYGVDILEVGYRQRGGCDLTRHVAVWDSCSRNGMFLTGTGVSDDHSGQAWRTSPRNFFTYAWASDAQEATLLDTIARGRCYFGDIQRFAGQLDLLVDGVCPMGSVSMASLPQRTLRITATKIPAGGWVSLVTGPVDYAGSTQPEPGTTSTVIPASAFAAGFVDTPIDTTTSRFVRVVVCDSTGRIVAGSNPIWLLTEQGPAPVPPQRLA